MVLGKVRDFFESSIIKYFAVLMLLIRSVYNGVLIGHDNLIVLAILVGILVLMKNYQ